MMSPRAAARRGEGRAYGHGSFSKNMNMSQRRMSSYEHGR
ncbi:hypothetical protein SFR_0029 [Streptomyces sp. FR-008]|nr:hypothetical protein SFR_0029 [Streptomyces sp. FR-008]